MVGGDDVTVDADAISLFNVDGDLLIIEAIIALPQAVMLELLDFLELLFSYWSLYSN